MHYARADACAYTHLTNECITHVLTHALTHISPTNALRTCWRMRLHTSHQRMHYARADACAYTHLTNECITHVLTHALTHLTNECITHVLTHALTQHLTNECITHMLTHALTHISPTNALRTCWHMRLHTSHHVHLLQTYFSVDNHCMFPRDATRFEIENIFLRKQNSKEVVSKPKSINLPQEYFNFSKHLMHSVSMNVSFTSFQHLTVKTKWFIMSSGNSLFINEGNCT